LKKKKKQEQGLWEKKVNFSLDMYVELGVLLKCQAKDYQLARQMSAQFTPLLKHHPWFFLSLTCTFYAAARPYWFCLQTISVIRC
jgi:hypothetical protein